MIFIIHILVFIIRLAKDLVSGVVIAAVVLAVRSPLIVLSCCKLGLTGGIVSKHIIIIVVSERILLKGHTVI